MTAVTNAIQALEGEREKLTLAIDALRHLNAPEVTSTVRKLKHTVSAQARAKMRKAQKARWARIRAAQRNGKPKLIKKAA